MADLRKEDDFMKKISVIICIMLALATVFCGSVSAGGKCFGWYCMRKPDHVRPSAEGEMSFIEKYGGAYIGKNPDEKVVYLTFDAGYENGNIARILDTLKKHNACGAFFVLENIIKRDTSLVRRMADEGHLVCNHTSRHKNMTTLTREEFSAELASLEATAHDVAGVEVAKFYRPPEGKFNEENLAWANELGYKTIFWSFAYADWDNSKQPDPERAKKLILDNIHNGAILLLHPTSKTNADILDSVLTSLENSGYRFGTLDEIFE